MPLPDEVGTMAQQSYAELAPLAYADPRYNWPFLSFLAAILDTMYQLIGDLVFDDGDDPGWSAALDLDRCPEVALDWLAQFVGVRLPGDLTEQEKRDYIHDTPGWVRGTPAAMIGAAKATLTGKQRLTFRERDGDPYFLTVRSYASETPDSNATLQALLAQKPGGILMDYRTMVGQDYLQLRTRFASYSLVKSSYPDYFGVKTDESALARTRAWIPEEA